MQTLESHDDAIGESDAFVSFQERLSHAAGIDRPVLLIGERGTGKELAARRLHYLSRRWRGPLVPLNCAALSPSLLEAELFGHEAGAFTGATQQREGRFERADGGTLFLDEIGLVPMQVQEKILRVVEYGAFERVGSSVPIETNVRIVAATNADLPAMARDGSFKQDLLDRLSFDVLVLPPLRERRSDIMPLAHHFAARMASELEWESVPAFSKEAVQELESYAWPGNIRELKNVVERAVYGSEHGQVDHINFDPFSKSRAPVAATAQKPVAESGNTRASLAFTPGSMALPDAVAAFEASAVQHALEQTQFHQGKAARLLGLSYDQFRRLMKKHETNLKGRRSE